MSDYPHVNAAFINAIAEEGTKAEAVQYLQKQWNETCALRARLEQAERERDEWAEKAMMMPPPTDNTPTVAEAAQVLLEVDLLPFDMDMCDAIDETDGGLWIDGDLGACISSDAMINCVRAALTSLAAQKGDE